MKFEIYLLGALMASLSASEVSADDISVVVEVAPFDNGGSGCPIGWTAIPQTICYRTKNFDYSSYSATTMVVDLRAVVAFEKARVEGQIKFLKTQNAELFATVDKLNKRLEILENAAE